MIIRKPTIYDISKAAEALVTNDPDRRDHYMSDWIVQNNNNPNFLSFVAVEDKKVIGYVTGVLSNEIISLGFFKANTSEILNKLFDTILKHYPHINRIYFITDNYSDNYKLLGFNIYNYNLVYTKPIEEKEGK
jgi:urate oxidase